MLTREATVKRSTTQPPAGGGYGEREIPDRVANFLRNMWFEAGPDSQQGNVLAGSTTQCTVCCHNRRGSARGTHRRGGAKQFHHQTHNSTTLCTATLHQLLLFTTLNSLLMNQKHWVYQTVGSLYYQVWAAHLLQSALHLCEVCVGVK